MYDNIFRWSSASLSQSSHQRYLGQPTSTHMRMNAGQMGKLMNSGSNTSKTALIVYMCVSKVADPMVAVCDQISLTRGEIDLLNL